MIIRYDFPVRKCPVKGHIYQKEWIRPHYIQYATSSSSISETYILRERERERERERGGERERNKKTNIISSR